MDWLPYGWADKFTVVEVGCGTGFNIRGLAARFPKARLVGLDIAVPMLSIAEKECQNVPNSLILKKLAYGSADEGSPDFFGNGSAVAEKPNVVLFSYCLTMVNPDWQRLVLQAKNDLPRGGKLAIVDFHDSPFALFRRWMRFNHVEMTGEILPFLQQHFSTVKVETRRAYFGLWRYFLFIGEKV